MILLLVLCLCCTAGGCSQTEEAPSTPTAAPTALPEFVPSTAGNKDETHDEFALYRDFLELNYVPLTTACGFISGVGLCDLDLDGCAELILFDAGASSSMGVQLFDVEDGKAVCVSASRVEVGSHGSLTPLHPPKAPQSLDLPIFFWSNLHFPIVVLRVLWYNGVSRGRGREIERCRIEKRQAIIRHQVLPG